VPLSEAQYGITERFYKDLLVNIGLYYFALEQCNAVISTYNTSVKADKKEGN